MKEWTTSSEARLVRPVPSGNERRQLPALAPAAALEHDARNALTSLAMIAGLLGEPGVLPTAHRHYAADLERVGHALGLLVERLAAIDRSTPALPASVPVSAGHALGNCSGMLKAVAGPLVAVHVSSESRLPPIAISEDALQRVLINLVKNAAEAMPGGGVVRVTARHALNRNTPAVLVHVSDNGPGIPSFALQRIFEPGFSSKQSGEPCGLGLAIVRELVEASGGTVEVASTRRRGTTFELRFPASLQESSEPPCTSVTGTMREQVLLLAQHLGTK